MYVGTRDASAVHSAVAVVDLHWYVTENLLVSIAALSNDPFYSFQSTDLHVTPEVC